MHALGLFLFPRRRVSIVGSFFTAFFPGLLAFSCHAQVPPSPAEKAGYKGLFAAAAAGDAAAVRAQLAMQSKPGERDRYDIVTIAAVANVHLADRDGRTPLALARRRGYSAMVKLLERSGS